MRVDRSIGAQRAEWDELKFDEFSGELETCPVLRLTPENRRSWACRQTKASASLLSTVAQLLTRAIVNDVSDAIFPGRL
jgi:hypothetical protein